MEAHAAVRLVPTRRGFTDVVQQRRPAQHKILAIVFEFDRLPQHRQRMLVDVLVLMVFVDRHPHRADLGQHHVAQPAVHHQVDARGGIGAEDQLVQFGGDTFGGDALELTGHRLHRLAHPRRDGEAELRDEPRRPQHPQRIVAEGHLGRGGRVEHPGPQRVQTAERIEEFAGPVGR